MIAYQDAVYQDSHQEFLYTIQIMLKDLNNWVIKCGGQFDENDKIVETSLSNNQLISYQIRARRLQSLLNFAVHSENLVNSLSQTFTEQLSEVRALKNDIKNVNEAFTQFRAAQCSPQCPRICNIIRTNEPNRTERNRIISIATLKNEMPNLF